MEVRLMVRPVMRPVGRGGTEVGPVNTHDLELIGDAELVEELSMLTTQTARMRSRMVDIMTELDRRRTLATSSPSANSW
jgi:hypothetical protein